MHDQWTRFDRLSPDKFMIAMYHSLHQAQKRKMLMEIANWQFKHCKIQTCPVKVCQNLSITMSHCFHFPNSNISVIPYTHVPTGKTFGLTASIVLFPDPL